MQRCSHNAAGTSLIAGRSPPVVAKPSRRLPRNRGEGAPDPTRPDSAPACIQRGIVPDGSSRFDSIPNSLGRWPTCSGLAARLFRRGTVFLGHKLLRDRVLLHLFPQVRKLGGRLAGTTSLLTHKFPPLRPRGTGESFSAGGFGNPVEPTLLDSASVVQRLRAAKVGKQIPNLVVAKVFELPFGHGRLRQTAQFLDFRTLQRDGFAHSGPQHQHVGILFD